MGTTSANGTSRYWNHYVRSAVMACLAATAACNGDDDGSAGRGRTGGEAAALAGAGGEGPGGNAGGDTARAGAGGSAGNSGSPETGGSAGGTTSSCDDGTGWDLEWQRAECEAIEAINQYRVAGTTCGDTQRPPVASLPRHQFLTDRAREHARYMADNGLGWPAEGPWDWLASAGFAGTLQAGEIASGQASGTELVDMLVAAGDANCSNVMVSGADKIAVGLYRTEAADFSAYWVVLLASGGD
jgi:hypothetical protein